MLKGREKLDGMEFKRRERWMIDGRARVARTRGRVLVKERLQHRCRFLDARTWVPRPCSPGKLSSEKGQYSAEWSACTSATGSSAGAFQRGRKSSGSRVGLTHRACWRRGGGRGQKITKGPPTSSSMHTKR